MEWGGVIDLREFLFLLLLLLLVDGGQEQVSSEFFSPHVILVLLPVLCVFITPITLVRSISMSIELLLCLQVTLHVFVSIAFHLLVVRR